MEINFHVLQIEFEFLFTPLIFGEITGLGALADIDLIFGMEINFHVLQIEFEFCYAPSIFGNKT